MQTQNVNPHITVTVRHEEVTDALREYAESKIENIHLDYPRIIEAKAILDVQGSKKNRHKAEIILFCANRIVIDASTETEDMYKSIDETVSKIARRMRKHKTRLLKKKHPRPEEEQSIKYFDERYYSADVLDTHPEDSETDPEPFFVHKEHYRLRSLYKEEAIMELDLTERPFVIFNNARRGVKSIVWKKEDGDYGMIDVD
ncbi:MAG: ribosome hibernation-promoting factor, HPF/YfiA family [Verrucomicrobiales bacterium]